LTLLYLSLVLVSRSDAIKIIQMAASKIKGMAVACQI